MFSQPRKRQFKFLAKTLFLVGFLGAYFGISCRYGNKAQETFAHFFGGLGMFIFGMTLMSASLQRIAGERLKAIVTSLTQRPLLGLLTGAMVTAIIQSSSATTVMTVGFVNAGIMTLKQAIGVILGANVGTTMTAQLIAFKLTDLALPIMAVGTAIFMAAKTRTYRSWGECLIGFSLLFFGMKLMGDSLKVYNDHPTFKAIFIGLSQNRLYGVFAGLLVTLIVQSSSATVGLTMSLMSAGAFGSDPYLALMAAVPIIFGDNIGTCITAVLAAVGTSKNAKRAAAAHTLFNLMGTLLFLPFLSWYVQFVLYFSQDSVRCLANAHTGFNVINAFLFLPFVEILKLSVQWLIPGRETEDRASLLDKRMLSTPPIALGQSEKELRQITTQVKNMIAVLETLLKNPNFDIDELNYASGRCDSLYQEIDTSSRELYKFLLALAQKDLSEVQAKILNRFLFLTKDLEIIASQLMKFLLIIREPYELGNEIPPEFRSQLLVCFDRDREVFDLLFGRFFLTPETGREILHTIHRYSTMDTAIRNSHLELIRAGTVTSTVSLTFLDSLRSLTSLLRSFEHFVRHAQNHF
jgi:phosphate:Na+ symporter